MTKQPILNSEVSESLVNSKDIIVKNLTVSYQGKQALTEIDLAIKAGTITGIIGPNGAGKTTFLKGIVGLIKTNSGEVTVGQQLLSKMRKNIAYVEQRSETDLTFPIKVEEVVLLGTYPKLGLFHRPSKSDKEKAAASLATVKMSAFAKRQIGELSGGQLQRVFIARALAQDADMIFLDEPFVGIDLVSEKVIVDVLKDLRDAGKTIVIVHHDLHKATEYFDELIILNKHLVANGPIATTFTTKNIQAAYESSMGEIVIKGVNEG